MGVGAGLYMCDVVKKFTFAISSPDEFLLPPPTRICFRRCLSVSNFAQKNFQTDSHESMKFSGKVGNGPLNLTIKFRWQSGSPSGYRDCFADSSTLGIYGKWLTDINLLLLIR